MAIGCLVLVSCAADQSSQQVSKAPSGIHETTSLYETATDHHRRSVRKPIRDQRERMLNLLAVKTDKLLTETDTWDSDARLTAVSEADRDEVRNTVQSFRGSLQVLKSAAEKSNMPVCEVSMQI